MSSFVTPILMVTKKGVVWRPSRGFCAGHCCRANQRQTEHIDENILKASINCK